MRIRTITLAVMLVLLVQFAVFACNKVETPSAKSAPEAHQKEMVRKSFDESKKVIAAKVNGVPISMFLLYREMNAIAPQYLGQGQQRTPELDAKIRQDALNIVIFQELVIQEAKKRGMNVAPSAIDEQMKKLRSEIGSEDAFQAHLEKNGFTEDVFRNVMEQDALFELMATQEIDAKIAVSEAAMREYYGKHKKEFISTDAKPRQLSFQEAKGKIEQRLRAKAGESRMQEWEKELRKNARIEIVEQKGKQG